jgi:acetoin utilization protein AcuC
MSGGLLVFSEDLTKYDFGSDHPMAPGRVTNTISLARQRGVGPTSDRAAAQY